MSEEVKSELIEKAKDIVQWFSIDFTIKIFGVTIISFHYPPLKNSK